MDIRLREQETVAYFAAMSATPAAVRIKIEFEETTRLGPGKVDLLEAIARTGSISAAGRALGMSYRRAWLLVDALNGTFGTPAVRTAAGGARGGGAALTPFGQALLEAYRGIEAATLAEARRAFAALEAARPQA